MSCDLTPVIGLLTAAGVSIAIAIAFVVAAAAANNSFFGAPGSPPLIIAAGVASLAAVGTLAGAREAVEAYFRCMGSPAECAGALSNLLNVIAALITVLSIQSTACFAAAGIAWIPWAGATPMYVILGAFIVQAALIPSAIVFVNDLITCAERAASTSTSSSGLTSATTLVISSIVISGLILGINYVVRPKKGTDKEG